MSTRIRWKRHATQTAKLIYVRVNINGRFYVLSGRNAYHCCRYYYVMLFSNVLAAETTRFSDVSSRLVGVNGQAIRPAAAARNVNLHLPKCGFRIIIFFLKINKCIFFPRRMQT